MNFSERPIALTDLETSGDVFSVHEILEIGLVLFHPKTFEIIDTLNVKVKPEHIENAVPAALGLNGYREEKWHDAVTLKEAVEMYKTKTENAVFASYNVSFDWGFINEAFHKTGIANHMSTRENHDRLDVLTLAWQAGLKKEDGSPSLKNACRLFGVLPEPEPHSALNGAMTGYLVFKKIME